MAITNPVYGISDPMVATNPIYAEVQSPPSQSDQDLDDDYVDMRSNPSYAVP